MIAIAWAIAVVGVLAYDAAYSFKFGQNYPGAGFVFLIFCGAVVGLIIASARP